MSENLNKKPPKGILKQSSSFDKAGSSNQINSNASGNHACIDIMSGSMHRKSTKFDEMNIIETLHPADKDYGHMKIEEPKTPFNYYEDGEDSEIVDQGIDPLLLTKRLESQPDDSEKLSSTKEESSSDEEPEDPEEKAKRQVFESKRKAHYNEYYAVKLARKLLEQEQDQEDNNEEEEEDSNGSAVHGFIPNEELD